MGDSLKDMTTVLSALGMMGAIASPEDELEKLLGMMSAATEQEMVEEVDPKVAAKARANARAAKRDLQMSQQAQRDAIVRERRDLAEIDKVLAELEEAEHCTEAGTW